MNDRNTGGPAFPSPNNVRVGEYTSGGHEGMTLRDYFAAKAMQGDIAAMVDPSGERCGIQIDLADESLRRLAALYYRMADAMLKEREK